MIKNNKIKLMILISLLILSIVIQGCDRRRPIPTYYQGYQGLELEFLNNAPPRTVTENTILSIMINVWNKGAYTIPEGETYINLNFDPVYFKMDTTDPNFLLSRDSSGIIGRLYGRSELWPEGEFLDIPLTKLKVQETPGLREFAQTNIQLSACYSYKTFFSEMICLDTDVYGVDENPICRNQGRFTYSNQGAPVAINKLEVDMLPMGFADTNFNTPANAPLVNESGELIGLKKSTTSEKLVLIEPVIRIYSKNVGRGIPFIAKDNQTNQIDAICNFNQENNIKDFNKVKVSKVTLEGLPMDCGKKTTLNLANPDDFVSCKLHINQTGYLRQNLKVPLSIELDYYYSKTIDHNIKIQKQLE